MQKKEEKAREIFASGGNCCQAVLGAFCEGYGFSRQEAFLVAAGLGGGVKSGEICGAISGAVIVIGLKYGRGTELDAGAKKICSEKTMEFVERFREKQGAVLCRDLLAKEPPPDLAAGAADSGHKQICFALVRDAVRLLQELGY